MQGSRNKLNKKKSLSEEDFFKLKISEMYNDVPCLDYKHKSNEDCDVHCEEAKMEVLNTHVKKLWMFYNKFVKSQDVFIGLSGAIKKKDKVNIQWCIVCGQKDNLTLCENCCASYHMACTGEGGSQSACPQCRDGCRVKYGDVIWYKLKKSQWWPAKLWNPEDRPPALRNKTPPSSHEAVTFFAEETCSWADPTRMCSFTPVHFLATGSSPRTRLNKLLPEAFKLAVEAYHKIKEDKKPGEASSSI